MDANDNGFLLLEWNCWFRTNERINGTGISKFIYWKWKTQRANQKLSRSPRTIQSKSMIDNRKCIAFSIVLIFSGIGETIWCTVNYVWRKTRRSRWTSTWSSRCKDALSSSGLFPLLTWEKVVFFIRQWSLDWWFDEAIKPSTINEPTESDGLNHFVRTVVVMSDCLWYTATFYFFRFLL